jgi:Ca2+-binding EF-hand superfamily protein
MKIRWFAETDPNSTGLVSYRQLQDIFIKLDKKLSQYQILFLISECNSNENGLVVHRDVRGLLGGDLHQHTIKAQFRLLHLF